MVWGCLLCDRFKLGNLTGSRTKKTGWHQVIQCVRHLIDPDTYLIIEDPILIPFIRFEFDSKSPEIANSICRPSLRSDRRYSHEDFCLLTNAIEKIGIRNIRHVIGDFIITPCSSCLCVNGSFGYSLTREMSQVLDELSARQKNVATPRSRCQLLDGVVSREGLAFGKRVVWLRRRHVLDQSACSCCGARGGKSGKVATIRASIEDKKGRRKKLQGLFNICHPKKFAHAARGIYALHDSGQAIANHRSCIRPSPKPRH